MAKLTPNEVEIVRRVYANKFWSKVKVGEIDECWPTTYRSGNPAGHKHMRVLGKLVYVHRIAWILTHGVIPEGLYVLHRCGNPKCCNPHHLYLGSMSDNAKDRVTDGTCHFIKHDDETITKVKLMLSEGHTHDYISKLTGVSRTYIGQIGLGRYRV